MEKVLINSDEYNGRYVAMKSFDDPSVVGSGNDPGEALQEALSKGFKDPVIMYIPEKEMVFIY